MPQDLQLKWNGRSADLIYENGDFKFGDSLDSSLNITIFTRGRVSPALAAEIGERGGWVLGNIGSQIWARLRKKKSANLLRELEQDVITATRYLIRNDIINSIKVNAEFANSSKEIIYLNLIIDTDSGSIERRITLNSNEE